MSVLGRPTWAIFDVHLHQRVTALHKILTQSKNNYCWQTCILVVRVMFFVTYQVDMCTCKIQVLVLALLYQLKIHCLGIFVHKVAT